MAQNATPLKRPQIAVLANIYKTHLHTQHIIDRILDGYGFGGVFRHSPLDVVAIYVEQRGEGDLTPERAKRYPGMKIYNSVADALTRGTGKLAVDGVVYIGEQGDYPRNEKGQTLYPRYQFFQKVVEVFRSSGRTVPYFNDKHLSWNWDWAKEMYDTSRKMGFPLMAGSSLPVTWRTPSLEMPLGARIREAVCVCYGGVDSYDFHGLETLQCMVERRHGGETGVKWLQAYRGDAFWKAHQEGVWPKDLVDAALCRSHTLKPARAGFNHIFPAVDEMRTLVRDPVAYRYEHEDGLTCTMLLLGGLVEDFNFAARVDGQPGIFSTQMYLPMPPARTSLANFFSPLVNNVQKNLEMGGKDVVGVVEAGIDQVGGGFGYKN